MSITMTAFAYVSDREIADAMVDDTEFAVNVLLAAAEQIDPMTLKEGIEELSEEQQTALDVFAENLGIAIKAPTQETL